MILKHEFVEFIPESIPDGVIFISMKYKTASHKCACGCGELVVTRLSPKDWNLYFDGESITLSPSIGNWYFACRSHYYIQKSRIVYVPDKHDWLATTEDNNTKPKQNKKKRKKK